jgi:hypothetical protein
LSPTCIDNSATAESNPAADPLQQAGAGVGLEPGEVVADRGLGVVQFLGRRRDRAAAADRFENAKLHESQHS